MRFLLQLIGFVQRASEEIPLKKANNDKRDCIMNAIKTELGALMLSLLGSRDDGGGGDNERENRSRRVEFRTA